jgi:hypothetical protein
LTIFSPVAVGGVGGSGTRVIAQFLGRLGYFMGHDLNEAVDNLGFTLLFKRFEIIETSESEFDTLLDIFSRAMRGADRQWSDLDREIILAAASKERLPQHTLSWLQARALNLLSVPLVENPRKLWGWKEPNTHLVLDRLLTRMPELRYIHVRRNGFDMACSRNQNQPRLWGKFLMGQEVSGECSPRHSLKYWCAAERRVERIVKSAQGRQGFHIVDYDNLCTDTRTEWLRLLRFFDISASSEFLDELVSIIKPPASIGRHRLLDMAQFDPDDVTYARSLEINPPRARAIKPPS